MNHHSPIAAEGLPSIAVPAVFAIIALAFGWRIPAVIQIAGFIARRIDCWVAQGMCIQKGERFGLIRFGSRVEVFLPYDMHIMVSAGDKVMGGETPIAELP